MPWPCGDCGLPHRRTTRLPTPNLMWEAWSKGTWGVLLCDRCYERRIGRKLVWRDFWHKGEPQVFSRDGRWWEQIDLPEGGITLREIKAVSEWRQ
jgi:hypothetical protein